MRSVVINFMGIEKMPSADSREECGLEMTISVSAVASFAPRQERVWGSLMVMSIYGESETRSCSISGHPDDIVRVSGNSESVFKSDIEWHDFEMLVVLWFVEKVGKQTCEDNIGAKDSPFRQPSGGAVF
jgi:hypothetical protein